MADFPPAVKKALLQAEKVLKPEDLVLFKELVQTTPPEELIPMLEQLAHMDWERKPVDVETFILHPDYLGLDGSRGRLYPKLMEDVIELFNGDYNEFVACGGIGWGKTYMEEVIAAIMLYELSCLKSPQLFYGLDPAVTLAVLNVSVSVSQAKKVLYARIRERLKSSPYFKEQFPFDSYVTSELKFETKNVALRPSAATEGGTVGYDLYGVLMDEVNFWDVVESSSLMRGDRYDQASHIYTLLRRRIESRFPGRPGKLAVVSSSKYPDDFTERRKKEIDKEQLAHELDPRLPAPKVMFRRYSQWTTKPPGTYPDERFWLYLGTPSERPEVSLDPDKFAEIKADPDKEHLVMEVPMNFYDQFAKDIDGSIRDIAGFPTESIKPFLPMRDKIADMFVRGDQAGMRHPFTSVETTLQGDVFDLSLMKVLGGRKYYVHVDLALKGDACGFALGHVDKWVRTERTNQEGELVIDYLPHVVIDLALRIKAPPGGEIQIDQVRALILELRSYGININKVTYDQWQSASSIQGLQAAGISAGQLSVDRTMEPYQALKELIVEDRIWMYEYQPLREELIRLEKNDAKNKVDHPPKGSKDVSDAVAGVCYHCVTETPSYVHLAEQGDLDASQENLLPAHLQGLEPTVDDEGRLLPGARRRSIDDVMFRNAPGTEDEDEDEDYVIGYV